MNPRFLPFLPIHFIHTKKTKILMIMKDKKPLIKKRQSTNNFVPFLYIFNLIDE